MAPLIQAGPGATARGPSPWLARLGLAPHDRAVILHADDVGMCPATVSAFAELALAGAVSSGSLMVPCPSFAAAAVFCRDHLEVDAGVHLTLTSEWESYRWGPLSEQEAASGLLDATGCFHRDSADDADPAAAEREMRAQLDRATSAGIDVTHVDCHMFAAFHPRLFPGYLRVARDRRLPALVWRDLAGEDQRRQVEEWEQAGLPVLDAVAWLPLGEVADRWEQARAIFDELPAGVTHLILHPAHDGPELRAIARDWPARVADFELFRSGRPREYLQRRGVHVIGYRALRSLLPARGA